MFDNLIFPLLVILCLAGASFITYKIRSKFFMNKDEVVRAALTFFTFVLSIAIVGAALAFAMILTFGR